MLFTPATAAGVGVATNLVGMGMKLAEGGPGAPPPNTQQAGAFGGLGDSPEQDEQSALAGMNRMSPPPPGGPPSFGPASFSAPAKNPWGNY